MTRRAERMLLAALCCLTVALYLSLLRAPFLGWDDEPNISANPYFLHLGWWRLWARPYFGVFVPVVSTMWAGLYAVGGGAAWPFRVANALLHATNVALVWQLTRGAMRRMGVVEDDAHASIAPLLGAILFALHPLQTAAVAWISGGRDLLATTLALAAVLVYFRRTRSAIGVATAMFAAALLSKPSVAAVPIAICAFVALFEPDRLRETIRVMSAWVFLALVAAAITVVLQDEAAPLIVPLVWRPMVAADALGFYLRELVWPVGLSVDHGRTPEWLVHNAREALLPIALLAFATLAVVIAARRRRWIGVAALWAILLAPVMGLTTFGFQAISTVADHYAYLPMAVVAIFVAMSVHAVTRSRRTLLVVAGACAVTGFGLSAARLEVWRSEEALFTDALEKNPRSWIAMTALGEAACERGAFDRGIDLLQRSSGLRPSEAPTLSNEAYCLYRAERYDDVIALTSRIASPGLQFSLEQNDRAASGFANVVAGAWFQRGDLRRGWPFLCQAFAIRPFDPDLQQNTGDIARLFAQRGVTARCPGRLTWAVFAREVGPGAS